MKPAGILGKPPPRWGCLEDDAANPLDILEDAAARWDSLEGKAAALRDIRRIMPPPLGFYDGLPQSGNGTAHVQRNNFTHYDFK